MTRGPSESLFTKHDGSAEELVKALLSHIEKLESTCSGLQKDCAKAAKHITETKAEFQGQLKVQEEKTKALEAEYQRTLAYRDEVAAQRHVAQSVAHAKELAAKNGTVSAKTRTIAALRAEMNAQAALNSPAVVTPKRPEWCAHCGKGWLTEGNTNTPRSAGGAGVVWPPASTARNYAARPVRNFNTPSPCATPPGDDPSSADASTSEARIAERGREMRLSRQVFLQNCAASQVA